MGADGKKEVGCGGWACYEQGVAYQQQQTLSFAIAAS